MSTSFAIPGDLDTPTGGYVYDRRVIDASGGALAHLPLPGDWPHPSDADRAAAVEALKGVGQAIIDGLAYGAFTPDMVAALPTKPVVLCHHPLGKETGLDAYEAAIAIKTEAAVLSLAAHIIVTSDETKRTLIAELGQDEARITVAPPGIDYVDAPARPEKSAPEILTVASLTPRKGHEELVVALARLKHLNWTARWVGSVDRDETHFEAVKAAIIETGLTSRIRIEGPLSGEGLEQAYAEADIFCLPSRYEGYGMVFAEAMMRALPIIACNTGAVADLVPPRAGILTPVNNPGAMAEALEELLEDAPFRAMMGDAGRTHALTIPGWDETWAAIRTAVEAHP